MPLFGSAKANAKAVEESSRPTSHSPSSVIVAPTSLPPNKEDVHKLRLQQAFDLFDDADGFVQDNEVNVLGEFVGFSKLP